MTPQSGLRSPPWRWFALWLLVGGVWAFAVLALLSVGLFVLPVALAATAVVAWRSHGLGVAGLVSGLGLPVLYVAYLNRGGPGDVCSLRAGGQTCIQEWSPWPWLTAAVLLFGVGLTIFVAQVRRR